MVDKAVMLIIQGCTLSRQIYTNKVMLMYLEAVVYEL